MPLTKLLYPRWAEDANKKYEDKLKQDYREMSGGKEPSYKGWSPILSADDLASGLVSSLPVGVAQNLADKTLGKSADILEQSAVGIKNYEPGLGKTLTDLGVRGTKEGMSKRVAEKIATEGAKLQDAVRAIPGTIESSLPAGTVSAMGDKLITSAGRVPEMAQPQLSAISEAATDIARRGAVNPTEALELKRIAQGLGYSLKSGEPMSKLASQIAQKEAFGYGDALANAYAERVGGDNLVKTGNETLSALLNAKRALGKGAKPAFNIIDSIADKSVNTPLIKSYGAKLLDVGSNVLGKVGAVGEKMLTMPSSKPSNAWTDEDEKELNDLKDMVRTLSNEQQTK